MWGTTPAAGGTTTVGVSFINSSTTQALYGAGTEASDTSTSSAYTPYVKAKPPRNSAAAFWAPRMSADTPGSFNLYPLVEIEGPSGSVLDIVMEVVFFDSSRTNTIAVTAISQGTAGAFAYPPLDGAGGILVPVGVSSAFA
jgi:hypothetical protein